MKFKILGPVEVWRDGEILPLFGSKLRSLLAGLVLRPNHPVSTDQLIHWLWGNEAPTTAPNQVQKGVSQLRALIGSDSIVRQANSYLILTDPENVDCVVFEHETKAARSCAIEGRPQDASKHFANALQLWRGRALTDVTSTLLDAKGTYLDELHLLAFMDFVDVEFALNHHGPLIAQLQSWVSENPYQDRLWAQLITAFYRSSRTADALASYNKCRKIFQEELGIEPSAMLRRLHEAILADDPDHFVSPPVSTMRLSARRAPAPLNLPAAIGDFTGRETQLQRVRDVLSVRSQRDTAARVAVPLVAISGRGGVGKTALALQVAHEFAGEFPDGRVYVSLQGSNGEDRDPVRVLQQLLRLFGADDSGLPDDREELVEHLQSHTAGRRILVVLDNAASESQIRPLIPGSPSCAALITSRRSLPGLDGVHMLNLDVFSSDEAIDLMESILGRQRVRAELEEARRITELCDRLPLAVRVAAAKLAKRPHWTLRRLAERLADDSRRLNEFSLGDLDVRAVMSTSYRRLSMKQRHALRMLGILDTPDFSVRTAAKHLGVRHDDAEELMEALVDARFLDVVAHDPAGRIRLRLDGLARIFARELYSDI